MFNMSWVARRLKNYVVCITLAYVFGGKETIAATNMTVCSNNGACLWLPRHTKSYPDTDIDKQLHTNETILLEDDILIDYNVKYHSLLGKEKNERRKRAATGRKDRIWDFGVIPYEIDGNFSGAHKALFKQAMRHWENYTCVKFVERTNEHPNYIVFTEKACGCCSFVGKRGNGPQAISIGKNCDKFGIVVHELGHAVGFWHEHTRPDRDNHVVIIKENIMTGQEYNFNKLTSEEVDSLGEPYDFDSIMHYARNTFSRSTFLDTILPREEPNSRHRPEIGQRIRLSKGDIAQANKMYRCSKCGRTLLEPGGVLQSPGYNSSTDEMHSYVECEWRIVATYGETIVLNITDFDIPFTEGCKHDYLEIRDGYWHKSPLLGRYCGPDLKFENPIVTNNPRMLVSYVRTSNSDGTRGFSAYYEAVCGGELDGSSGHLESPNFPEEYFPSKECVWRITVPEGYQVSLTFSTFQIESHGDCVYDFVEVRDGNDTNSRRIGLYCGFHPPNPITSTGSQMYVRFVSDGSVEKGGFSASYLKELDECARGLDDCEHTCTNTIGGYDCACKFGYELHSNGKECENACGGTISEENGTLTSPSFPNTYPSNKHCAWEIVGGSNEYRITVNFTHFDLEGNNQECDYDSVEVYSKLSQDELKRHGSYCGNKPPPMITSEGSSLRIVFTSDNSVQKSGFSLNFFSDKDECVHDNGGCAQICRNTVGSYICLCEKGFVLHENLHDCKEGGCKFELTTPEENNEITSPNWPEPYPGKKECIWVISTTEGHRVKIVFWDFEVEPQQDCSYDYVVVYDGDNSNEQLLGKFCGSKIPRPLTSSSNSLMILFKSDGSVHRGGFRAQHSSVCGGVLTAWMDEESYLYSHALYGDSKYSEHEDCEWIIELMVDMYDSGEDVDSYGYIGEYKGPASDEDYHIQLTFLSFEIEDENECTFDYVEIFKVENGEEKSLGRYCGNVIPPVITSPDTLLIRFKSDDSINSKGFHAKYTVVASGEYENSLSY